MTRPVAERASFISQTPLHTYLFSTKFEWQIMLLLFIVVVRDTFVLSSPPAQYYYVGGCASECVDVPAGGSESSHPLHEIVCLSRDAD